MRSRDHQGVTLVIGVHVSSCEHSKIFPVLFLSSFTICLLPTVPHIGFHDWFLVYVFRAVVSHLILGLIHSRQRDLFVGQTLLLIHLTESLHAWNVKSRYQHSHNISPSSQWCHRHRCIVGVEAMWRNLQWKLKDGRGCWELTDGYLSVSAAQSAGCGVLPVGHRSPFTMHNE